MLIFALLFLVLTGGGIIALDKYLAYFDQNIIPFWKPLPLNLTIESQAEFEGDGYVIKDEAGFALIGKGVSYRDIDIMVDDLLGYGIQQTEITAKIRDKDGATHFIRVKKQTDPSSNNPFTVSFAENSEKLDDPAFQWISLGDDGTKNQKIFRTLFGVALLLDLGLIFFLLGKRILQ